MADSDSKYGIAHLKLRPTPRAHPIGCPCSQIPDIHNLRTEMVRQETKKPDVLGYIGRCSFKRASGTYSCLSSSVALALAILGLALISASPLLRISPLAG